MELRASVRTFLASVVVGAALSVHPAGALAAVSEAEAALKFLETFMTRAWLFTYPDLPVTRADVGPCRLVLRDSTSTRTIDFAKLNAATVDGDFLKLRGRIWEDQLSDSFQDRWIDGIWYNFGAPEPADRAKRAFHVLISACDPTRGSGY